jgi:hypothetical protein
MQGAIPHISGSDVGGHTRGGNVTWRRRRVVAAACLFGTVAVTVLVVGCADLGCAGAAGALSNASLLYHQSLSRRAPGAKGRRGTLDESQIKRETMKVIEDADNAASRRPAATAQRLARSHIVHTRDAVNVVHDVAAVVAETKASVSKQEAMKTSDVVLPTSAAPAVKPSITDKAPAAAISPRKWNWEQWQEQEKKALSVSSSLPTSAASAEKIAEKAAAVRLSAAKVAAEKIAAAALQSKLQKNIDKPHVASHTSAASARPAAAAAGAAAATTSHLTPSVSTKQQVRADEAKTFDAAEVYKKSLVHTAASAKMHKAQAASAGDMVPVAASAAGTTKKKGQYQAKWNWAQWQEEAKQLLLHSAGHSDSKGQKLTSSSKSGHVAKKGLKKRTSSSSTTVPSSAESTVESARKKTKEAKSLLKRVKALEEMQQNNEALSKVVKADATIKSEITSVMKHVKQLDKEKHFPDLSSSAHGKHTKNTFTKAGGKVVATSLSKSTLKAMKEAQQAGWAADMAAKQRAKAEAAANYAKMRDEMFRKDAEKQVKDEQQLRAEKKVRHFHIHLCMFFGFRGECCRRM